MSQFISLSEGVAMTTAYRAERSSLISNGSVGADLLPIHETFEKGQVHQLMSRTGCEGLRIYLGMEEGKIRLILVGTDSTDKDILPPAETNAAKTQNDEDEDYLLERGVRCPNECPSGSDLNP